MYVPFRLRSYKGVMHTKSAAETCSYMNNDIIAPIDKLDVDVGYQFAAQLMVARGAPAERSHILRTR